MKIIKKIQITGKINILTGIHIGGSKESADIGGIDLPVVRNSLSNEPYIPGSSLKGKIRSLLEQSAGVTKVGDDKRVNGLFGITAQGNREQVMTRLIVRDCRLTKESKKALEESEFVDLPFTEVKFENTINRVLGKAEHPRQIERVPAGSVFDLELIVNVHDEDSQDSLLELLKSGMRLLELDYLGGNGSRGYGKVEFCDLNAISYDISENVSAGHQLPFSLH